MKIAIASDHAGITLKQQIIDHLKQKNIDVIDFGTNSLTSVDYPDYAQKCARSVQEKKVTYGILICGSGIGMSIAANKFKGIRCALIYDEITAKLAKEHNHANIIAIGDRLTDHKLALKMVDIFLTTQEDPRHNVRVNKLNKLGDNDNECCSC